MNADEMLAEVVAHARARMLVEGPLQGRLDSDATLAAIIDHAESLMERADVDDASIRTLAVRGLSVRAVQILGGKESR